MPQLAILADIHGNLPALHAVMDDMKNYDISQVIVAGDLINNVPFNADVMHTAIDNRWSCIRGNHEFYLLNRNTKREKGFRKDSKLLAFLENELIDWKSYISAMPNELTLVFDDLPQISVVHGVPNINNRAITPHTSDAQKRVYLQNLAQPIMIYGHYHSPMNEVFDNTWLLNPGSVGCLMNGEQFTARYMLLFSENNEWHATFRKIPYDFDAVDQRIREIEYFKKAGVLGVLSYLQVKLARPIINGFISWHSDHYDDEAYTTDQILEFGSDTNIMWKYFPEAYKVKKDALVPITAQDILLS